MKTPTARRKRLRSLMKHHELSCNDVARLLDKAHVTVRKWSCGMHAMPPHSLEVLESRLGG